MSKWYALYSQTGSELQQVCERMRKFPDGVFTNNTQAGRIESRFMTHRDLMQWLRVHLKPEDVVTLHGYLRVIPDDVLETGAKFYNGHPGFIEMYPELRGLDPQEKVLENFDDYKMIGCVIHDVTTEVDGGRVLLARAISTTEEHRERKVLYETLHRISVELWVDFLREVLHAKTS